MPHFRAAKAPGQMLAHDDEGERKNTMSTHPSRFLWIALVILALSAVSSAQIGVGISVSFGPPPLPIYAQPLCPGAGYIWTPGYWAYDPDFGDYYWVPGTWVVAPEVGFLWTPGWWGWGGSGFLFHAGYWGPVVGFYGGINYGYGYFGHGYEGGRWDHGQFYYNRSVNNVNITNIHNVYNTTVVNNSNHVSYNGGKGGINARPTTQEEAAARERHVPPVAAQNQQVEAARSNTQLRASVNHGKPPIAATPRAGAFEGSGVVAAKQAGGKYTPPPNRAAAEAKPNNSAAARPESNPVPRPPQNNAQTTHAQNNAPRPPTAVHPNDLPAIKNTPVPDTGNAELNQKYQQQQDQLRAQQQQERQKLQQQQDQEHQQLAQQKANQQKQQQLEQQHAQQTQRMYQQHQQQQQQLARQQHQEVQAHQQPHASEPKPKQ